MKPPERPDPLVRHLVAFGRALREEGLAVDASRVASALAAIAALGASAPAHQYWGLRQTFVSRLEEIEAFDRVFAIWFLGHTVPERPRPPRLVPSPRDAGRIGAGPDKPNKARVHETGAWSPHEVLRHKDFALLTETELTELAQAIATLASSRPRRRSRRVRPAVRGRELDLRKTIRASLRTGGDPLHPAYRRRVQQPRRMVVLCDISGSMETYAPALLLFAEALLRSGRGVEVFGFGTRLTRLTGELTRSGACESLTLAAHQIVDWAGGTRIGESLRTFNETWARRGTARGAVVIIVSDGWEREDAALVAREMARLRRSAYAVIWINPLKGQPGYEPLAAGMRAALPFVDRFLSGNDLAAMEEVAAVLATLAQRHFGTV